MDPQMDPFATSSICVFSWETTDHDHQHASSFYEVHYDLYGRWWYMQGRMACLINSFFSTAEKDTLDVWVNGKRVPTTVSDLVHSHILCWVDSWARSISFRGNSWTTVQKLTSRLTTILPLSKLSARVNVERVWSTLCSWMMLRFLWHGNSAGTLLLSSEGEVVKTPACDSWTVRAHVQQNIQWWSFSQNSIHHASGM